MGVRGREGGGTYLVDRLLQDGALVRLDRERAHVTGDAGLDLLGQLLDVRVLLLSSTLLIKALVAAKPERTPVNNHDSDGGRQGKVLTLRRQHRQ